MKRIIIKLAVILLFVNLTFSAQQNNINVLKIKYPEIKTLFKFYDYLKANNVKKVKSILYNRVFYVIGKIGLILPKFFNKTKGRTEFIKLFFKFRPNIYNVKNLKITDLGKTRLFVYNISMVYSRGRKYSGKEVMVLIKKKDKWKICGLMRYLKRL